MAEPTPPEIVLIEFLARLRSLLGDESYYDVPRAERILPVLRGSLLLRHWFGDAARPAADLDFECFERRPTVRRARPADELTAAGDLEAEDYWAAWHEGATLVSEGHALAQRATHTHAPAPPSDQAVDFTESPEHFYHEELWRYGISPGARCRVNWRMRGASLWSRMPLVGGQQPSGELQLDFAEPVSYTLDDIVLADAHFVPLSGQPFRFAAYSPEMLLAAKLSWLLRSFTPRSQSNRREPPAFTGEMKDLFDAHLLVTHGELDPAAVQKCLLAVTREDRLQWSSIDCIFAAARSDKHLYDFDAWREFQSRAGSFITAHPLKMLQGLAEKLPALLGDFYAVDEAPFVQAIHESPNDENAYVIYADWLEERGDPRSELLRQYVAYALHFKRMSGGELRSTQKALAHCLRATREPWLLRLLGSVDRLESFRNEISAAQT